MTTELSLVPPGRLAALLSTARRRSNLDTVAIAQRSAGRFSPAQLDEIERGRVALADTEVEALTELYEVDSGPIVPERSRLIVDLGQGQMTIAQSGVSVGTGSGEVDTVLERYLSLLYILRGLEPGSELTLRDRDLAVLGETLEQEFRDVERKLGQLMGGAAVKERTGLLGRRFSVPGAGLLVALTALGSLIIVGGGVVGGENGDADSPVDVDPVAAQIDANAEMKPASTLGGARSLLLPASFSGAGGQDAEAATPTSTPVTTQISTAFANQVGGAETGAVSAAAAEQQAPVTAEVAQVAEVAATPEVDAASQWAALGAEAEALLSYDWQSALPGWTIEYVGDKPGYRGMTHTPTNSIAIYINDGDTAQDVAGILAHEIGHAIDVTHLDNDSRSAWLEARGLPRVWWPGSGLGDFHVGAGDWAEGVAALISNSPSDSAYGEFTAEQLDLVRQLLPGNSI